MTKIFKVSGYKPLKGQTTDYYRASTEGAVHSKVKSVDVEQGGFVNFSIEEIEILPAEVNITCPSCNHEFESPDRVHSVP